MMVIRFRPFEETEFDRDFWRMFWVSLALHLAVIFFIALARKIAPLPIYYAPPSATTVDLVSMAGQAQKKAEAPAPPQEKAVMVPPKPKAEEKILIPDVKKEKKAPEIVKKAAPEAEKAVKKKPVPEKPPDKDYSNKDIRSAIENLKKKISEKDGGAGSVAGQGQQQAIAGRGAISSRLMEIRYKTYYSTIWEIIRDAWIIPQGISIERDMETVIGIVIEKNGKISDITIEKNSGNQAFDDSTIRAIEKSSPLPPIPGEEEELPVGIRFTPEDYQ